MDDRYRIFVGFSEDASQLAESVTLLKETFQLELERLNDLVPNSKKICDFFNWKFNADSTIGGQKKKVDPHIENADIAVFLFYGIAGEGVRQELNKCIEQCIPVVALFPDDMPPNLDSTCIETLHGWTALNVLRSEISDNWMDEASDAVTPQEQYTSHEHAVEIVKHRLLNDLHRVFRARPVVELHEAEQTLQPLFEDSHTSRLGINKLFPDTTYDMRVVQQYTELLLDRRNGTSTSGSKPDEFIRKMGFLVGNQLTVGGVLLFTERPSERIKSAVCQCTRYFGNSKASRREISEADGPIFLQMDACIDFIKKGTQRHEYPREGEAQSDVVYQYPMICVREIIANSICHRDYFDDSRQNYVRIFDDRIEIANPGGWRGAEHLAEQQEITDLVSEPVHTNYHISRAFGKIGYIELEGSGIAVAAEDCRKHSARIPTVKCQDGYVVVTIFPSGVFGDLARTRGAGELAFNTDMSKFKLVPIDETNDDEVVFSALVDALKYNIDRVEGSNQFGQIGGQVEKLKNVMIARPRNPLRVYDVMEGCLYSIQQMSARAEIPSISSDANLSEFVRVLETGLVDLKIVNPRIEKIVETRAKQRIRRLDYAEKNDLIDALRSIEELFDEDLNEDFQEDTRIIFDDRLPHYEFDDVPDRLVRTRMERLANRISQMHEIGEYTDSRLLENFRKGVAAAQKTKNYLAIAQSLNYLLSLISFSKSD